MKNKLTTLLIVGGIIGLNVATFNIGRDLAEYIYINRTIKRSDNCTPEQYEYFKSSLPEIEEILAEGDTYFRRLKKQTEYEINTFEKSKEGRAYLKQNNDNP